MQKGGGGGGKASKGSCLFTQMRLNPILNESYSCNVYIFIVYWDRDQLNRALFVQPQWKHAIAFTIGIY